MSDPETSPADARRHERFAEICRDHGGLIARTTYAFAPDRADRADLGQEILLAIWHALPQFDARARLTTYIYRVSLNCALNWRRSQRRYRLRLDHYHDFVPELEAGSAADQDRLRWLYAEIHALPPVDRSLILLSLDRVGYAEIAEITGLSESNVGVRLHRIKQHLTNASEKYRHEN
ncbi:MAG TPA: sigma-70 family RNA polymerase sigma factor [Lacunisphaera sp.]|nr:sigma-70 family RNA polymerase sigma factor [Lacunisphaera sp.]